jgi:hypothetical protein
MLMAGYAAALPGAAAVESAASLTIDIYTCDALHDPIDPNQTLVNECALGTEDIPFTLEPVAPQGGSMMASTGSGGSPATIAFSNLSPGDYRLVQDAPESIAHSYIAQCDSNVRSFDYPFSPFATIEQHGRLNIQLLPNEQLECAWYNVLASEQASATSLTVTVYSCSGDVIDPEICDPAPDVELRLFGPSAEIILTTDTRGVATYDGTGRYQIEAVSEIEDRDFCGFQTPSGDIPESLALDPAQPVTLEAFYCYPGA